MSMDPTKNQRQNWMKTVDKRLGRLERGILFLSALILAPKVSIGGNTIPEMVSGAVQHLW